MTVRKPLALTGVPAEDYRLAATPEYSAQGIFGTNDLAVSQNGTPNMSVNVAAGTALVLGTRTATQGMYSVVNDASANLAIAASNPTLPRVDIVVLTVRDSDYVGDATKDAILQVITGTAASSPVAPAVPASSLLLATISVGANVSNIVTANITDNRNRAAQKPGVFIADVANSNAAAFFAAAGQSVDIVSVRDNLNSWLMRVTSNGGIHGAYAASTATTGLPGASNSMGQAAINVYGLVVKKFAGATSDVLVVVDENNSVLFEVRPDSLFGNASAGNFFNASLAASTTCNLFKAADDTQLVLGLRPHSGAHSGDMTQWQNASNNAELAVDKNRHIGGRGTAPTLAAGAALGTSPPAITTGTASSDQQGQYGFGSGTAPAAGVVMTVTFNRAYSNAPRVVLTPTTGATVGLGLYISAVSTTGFTISCQTAPAASQANTVYGVNYVALG